jgi:hypothetical protein
VKATLALVVAVFVSLIATRIAAAGDADRLWRVFLCIHRHEGDWDANTGNGYYGGLQMDRGFQLAYGREFYLAFGTADHWTPAMQITVAIRAYLAGRGFTPWPNTRGMCGL